MQRHTHTYVYNFTLTRTFTLLFVFTSFTDNGAEVQDVCGHVGVYVTGAPQWRGLCHVLHSFGFAMRAVVSILFVCFISVVSTLFVCSPLLFLLLVLLLFLSRISWPLCMLCVCVCVCVCVCCIFVRSFQDDLFYMNSLYYNCCCNYRSNATGVHVGV